VIYAPRDPLRSTDTDVRQAATSWLPTLDKYFFYVGIQTLVPRRNNYLNPMVTTFRSGVNHLLHMCNVYIEVKLKFSASECLLL